MIEKWKNSPPIAKFLIKFLSIMAFWKLIYAYLLKENGIIDQLLTKYISLLSLKTLQLLGYPMTTKINEVGMYYFYLGDDCQLQIAHSCNGLILFVLFIAFLVSFKGDWLLKIIVSIIGCFGIFLINVIRVVALMLVNLYYPQYLNFSHHWLFSAMVYAFVFSLWLLWINKFSEIKLLK
jgi:exosortase family protein XrtF